MEIVSERLILRLVHPTDMENVHALHSEPAVVKYNTIDIPKNMDEIKLMLDNWAKDQQLDPMVRYTFVIEQAEKGDFIGLIALNLGREKLRGAETWYLLHPTYWGNGYATEAVRRVIKFGFEDLKLHRIEAGCAIDNIGSIRVLEKAGMIQEGGKRKVLPLESGWSDNYQFAILETD